MRVRAARPSGGRERLPAQRAGRRRLDELEEESGALLAEVLTDEEIDVLGPRIEAMDPISSTSWPLERAAADEDFIYFISAGVDPEKRGSGAFRRLFTPFLEYADEHGLACYLDCYTERLEQLYGHFGFETVERRSIDASPSKSA